MTNSAAHDAPLVPAECAQEDAYRRACCAYLNAVLNGAWPRTIRSLAAEIEHAKADLEAARADEHRQPPLPPTSDPFVQRLRAEKRVPVASA